MVSKEDRLHRTKQTHVKQGKKKLTLDKTSIKKTGKEDCCLEPTKKAKQRKTNK
uniref:Uncharacterized protein n=1 Tax=Arion vulgaris TaxID=1028688 RepID=A0A0B6Y5Q9_9EUPU